MRLSFWLPITFVATIAWCNSLFAQSQTYQALLNLNFTNSSNRYDLPKLDVNNKSFLWSNTYFNYYKNPNIHPMGKPDESMIFSIGQEFVLVIPTMFDDSTVILLPKTTKIDKVKAQKILIRDTVKGKETNVKKNYYKIERTIDATKISIRNDLVRSNGQLLLVYIEQELFDFSTIKAFPFQISFTFADIWMSFNVPEVFDYTASFPDLELADKNSTTMTLIRFNSNRGIGTSPLENYKIENETLRWNVPKGKNLSELNFLLNSITLTMNFGTSSEQVLKYSK